MAIPWKEDADQALAKAWDDKQMSLIQVHLGLNDISQALERLAEHLSKRV